MKTQRSSKLLILLIFLLAFTACDRKPRGYGGAKGSLLGDPKYSEAVTAPAVSLIPAASHVQSVAPQGQQEQVAIDPAQLFVTNCSACHQASGAGIPAVFPPLDGSEYVIGDNVERMVAIMVYGLIGPVKVKGVQYQSAMAGLGSTLSDEELAAIGTYIRTSWSNSASAVDVKTISEVRKKYGTRGPFNIQELGEEP